MKTLRVIILIVSATLTFSKIIIYMHLQFGNQNYHQAQFQSQPLTITSYHVQFTTPTQNQLNRGTCWAFTTIRFLEAEYLKQSIQNHNFPTTSYTQFSVQAHAKTSIFMCQIHPNLCLDAPILENTTDDGYPSWIFTGNDVYGKSLLPELKSCPYVPEHCHANKCDEYDEFIANNCISYKVNYIKQLSSFSQLKTALQNRQTGIPVGIELLHSKNHIPAHFYNQPDEPCPEHLQNANFDLLCSTQPLMHTADSFFLTPDEYLTPTHQRTNPTLGIHHVLLVGFNDKFRIENSLGIFILENSWGSDFSHSLEWLTGEISKDFHCPNARNPRNFVHFGVENFTILHYNSTPQNGIRGNSTHFTRFLFGLNLSDLDRFAIGEKSHFSGRNFIFTVFILQSEQSINSFVTPPIPIDFLAFHFIPVKMTENGPKCGFSAVSYDYLRKVQEIGGYFWGGEFCEGRRVL